MKKLFAVVTATAMLFSASPAYSMEEYANQETEQETTDADLSGVNEQTELTTEVAETESGFDDKVGDEFSSELSENVIVDGAEMDIIQPDAIVTDSFADEGIEESAFFEAADLPSFSITSITLSLLFNPAEQYTYSTESYLKDTKDMLQATVVTTDGTYVVSGDDWEYAKIEVGGQSFAVAKDVEHDTGVAVMARDQKSNDIIDFNWAYMPDNMNVIYQPFVFDGDNMDAFKDSSINVSYPSVAALSTPITGTSTQTSDSDTEWFCFTPSETGDYRIIIKSEGEFNIYGTLLGAQGWGDRDYFGITAGFWLSQEGDATNRFTFIKGRPYYFHLHNNLPESNVSVSVVKQSPMTAISLDSVTVSLPELQYFTKYYQYGFLSGNTRYKDGTSCPIAFGEGGYSTDDDDNVESLYGKDEQGSYVDLHFFDRNGEPTSLKTDQEGIYTLHATCYGDESISSNNAKLTVTKEPSTVELGKDRAEEIQITSSKPACILWDSTESDETDFTVSGSGISGLEGALYYYSGNDLVFVGELEGYFHHNRATISTTLETGKKYLMLLAIPSFEGPGREFNGTIEYGINDEPYIPSDDEILDVFKNAQTVTPGVEYSGVNQMYKLRIEREGEAIFYFATDMSECLVPIYTDLTEYECGYAMNLKSDKEYFYEYYSEENGNIAFDGYAYFEVIPKEGVEPSDFTFTVYPEIRIDTDEEYIHDGGASEDVHVEKGDTRTFIVDAFVPFGTIKYTWGIKDWSGPSGYRFVPLQDDTGTEQYTFNSIPAGYTELTCRMTVLNGDDPLEGIVKDYDFCIHAEGEDDPGDGPVDDYNWSAFDASLATENEVGPGKEVTFTLTIRNTTDSDATAALYPWYYRELNNSETYSGVEFGTISGEGYSSEEGLLSIAASQSRTLTLTGTIPETWNNKSAILIVVSDPTNKRMGQFAYPFDVPHSVTYQFAASEESTVKELPEEVNDLLPDDDNTYYTGQVVYLSYPASSKVDMGEAYWIFDGYDGYTSDYFELGTSDVVITGSWTYTIKTADEIAADTLLDIIDDDADDIPTDQLMDIIENSDSDSILEQMKENLADVVDNVDDMNSVLAKSTAKLDELLVDESGTDATKKVTVTAGEQTVGAYVAKTEPAETDGIKVEISGAAATVASVIREEDMATLTENNNKHYQAEVSVTDVEDNGTELSLNISLNIKIKETGDVVKTNAEPASPITVVVKLPERYVGYRLKVTHTINTAAGEKEVLDYSFIDEGRRVQFTISSLSPFEMKVVGCLHNNMNLIPRQEATCASNGHIAYYYCDNCETKYRDESGENVLNDNEIVIAKTGIHSWNGGAVTKPATENTEGTKTYTCTVCGANKTEVIPRTAPVPQAPPADPITINSAPVLRSVKAAKKGAKATVNLKKLEKPKKKGKKKQNSNSLWNQVSSIQLQYSTDPSFTTGVITKTLGKGKASVNLGGLQKGVTYYVRARYVGNGGFSNWSGTKTVKVKNQKKGKKK